MKLFPRLLLKCRFEIVDIAGEATAVGVGDEKQRYRGVILLKNDSSRFLFEKLQEGITLPELIRACMEKYPDSTVEEVGPTVIDFLDRMREQGLLLEDREHGIRVND